MFSLVPRSQAWWGGGEVHLGGRGSLERRIAVEFGAVVARERVDRMRLLPQGGNRASIQFGDGACAEFAEEEIAGLPFDATHDAVPMAFGADDGIAFPVADARTGLDDSRPGRDGAFAGEATTAVVVAIAFAALLRAAAQVSVQGAARPFVGPTMPVDRLVADPEPALVAQAAGDLLRAPALAELAVDLAPIGRGESLIAAGARPAGPGVGIGELGAVPAIVVRRIAADLPVDRAAMTAEQPRDGRRGIAVLAEAGNRVSFGGGDLGVHR